jgi:predicted dehydrogenase
MAVPTSTSRGGTWAKWPYTQFEASSPTRTKSTGDRKCHQVFTFESGCLGEIDVSRNGVYGYDIRAEVLGTSGTIKVITCVKPHPVLTAGGHRRGPHSRTFWPGHRPTHRLHPNVSEEKEPSVTAGGFTVGDPGYGLPRRTLK